MAHESQQNLFQLRFAHLSVADADAALGKHFLNKGGSHEDGVHAIVYEIHLPLAREFLFNGGFDQVGVKMSDYRVDRQAIFRRRLDDRHVAQAEQRHVQSARNRSGAHGEHIHVVAELLQSLFVADAEALFFIDDQQTQIVEDHVFREHTMSADEHVHFSNREIFENGLHFLRSTKTADQLNTYGEGSEAAAECLIMLKRENRGGSEDGDLLAIAKRLEGGAHGHFRLAEADIAA